jgi:hypothetical protein
MGVVTTAKWNHREEEADLRFRGDETGCSVTGRPLSEECTLKQWAECLDKDGAGIEPMGRFFS